MRQFKILVRGGSKSCIETAEFIDENIHKINNLGVIIKMQKLNKEDMDEETLEKMSNKGITRLPALISDRGDVIIGRDAIIEYISRGVSAKNADDLINPTTSTGSTIQDYLMEQMYAGRDKNGRLIPRDDEDDEIGKDDEQDIKNRLAAYKRNRPRHHNTLLSEDNIEDLCDNCGSFPCRCGGGNGRGRGNIYQETLGSIEQRNMRDEFGGQLPGSLQGTTPGTDLLSVGDTRQQNRPLSSMSGDDMDAKMLSAWMQNTPPSDF